MKTRQRKLFLEELRKLPIVQVACDKSGISRNTVYRWRKTNEVFAREMDEALDEGVGMVNDMTESSLLNLIRGQEFSAVRFWLKHRHPAYRDPSPVIVKEEKDVRFDKEVFQKSIDEYKAKLLVVRKAFNPKYNNSEAMEENEDE